jgi:hypothetical protein
LAAGDELLGVLVEDFAGAPQLTASRLDRPSGRVQRRRSQQKVLASGAERDRAGVHCPDGGNECLELAEECVQALPRLIDGVGVPAGALGHAVQILGRPGKPPYARVHERPSGA